MFRRNLEPLFNPATEQKRNYPEAIKRDCPVCVAKAGEPCAPASLAIPHLLRCRDEREDGAA